MVIKAIGYASLKQFSASLNRDGGLSVHNGATVADVLEKLGIPQNTKVVTMINGRHCTPDRPLADGDNLVFFPPLEGG